VLMNILNELKGCRTIAVSGHERPDGDCVGSCMGLAQFLYRAMPDARIDVFLESISDALEEHIAGAEKINHSYQTDIEAYDAFVCLDCEKTRLGASEPIFDRARRTINIDHHVSNPGCGDVNYVVPEASSSCELVFNVLDPEGTGAPFMNEETARNLYIGMVTDTGVFRYSNTGRRTMEIAGYLMTFGFDYPTLVRDIFYEKTIAQQRITARVLLDSALYCEGAVLAGIADKETVARYGASDSDLDGISSQMVLTRGVECSVFLHELPDGRYKGSLRSNNYVDVARVCESLGGGGHVRAAGFTADGDPQVLLQNIIEAVSAQLAAEKNRK